MTLNPIDVESLKKPSTEEGTISTPSNTSTTTLPTTSTDTIKTDYDVMASTTDKIKDTVININDILNEANKAVDDLNNESTFYGPVAEYCLTTWEKITTLTMNDSSTLSTSATTLDAITENYRESDSKSGESVGGV